MSGTLFTHNVLLVVTAADRAQANADMQTIDPTTTNATFFAGLVVGASVLSSHYWAGGVMTDAQYAACVALFGPGNSLGRQMFDLNQTTPAAVLAQTGLSTPVVLG